MSGNLAEIGQNADCQVRVGKDLMMETRTRAAADGRHPRLSLLPMALGAGVVLALLLAACSSAPEDLESTSWQLTQIGDQQPVPGTTVTIQFDDTGSVDGTTGCNSYSGPYEVERANISMGPFASTLVGCPGAVGVQETTYLTALQITTTYTVDGDTLTFFNAEGETLLSYARLSTDLAGTTWDVTSYNTDSQAVRSLIIDTTISLNFGTDGTVAGNAGCNDYSGSYEVGGDNVTIGPLAVTQQACAEPAGIAEQEMQYLAALENSTVHAINNARLELRDDDGSLQVQGNPAG